MFYIVLIVENYFIGNERYGELFDITHPYQFFIFNVILSFY